MVKMMVCHSREELIQAIEEFEEPKDPRCVSFCIVKLYKKDFFLIMDEETWWTFFKFRTAREVLEDSKKIICGVVP